MGNAADTTNAVQQRSWHGELVIGDWYACFRGVIGDSAIHQHLAHQVVVADQGSLRVAIGTEIIERSVVLIPALAVHRLIECHGSGWIVFVEPYALSIERFASFAASSPPAGIDTIIASLQSMRVESIMSERAKRLVSAIDDALPGAVSATEIAQRLAISPSQLQRRSRATFGVAVRRLLRWRRLRCALLVLSSGGKLTDAAHEAGFSDSSHFSRTMKDMFGVRADLALLTATLRVDPRTYAQRWRRPGGGSGDTTSFDEGRKGSESCAR